MILTYNNDGKEVSVEVTDISIASQAGFYTLKEIPYAGIELRKVIHEDDVVIDLNIWGFDKNKVIIE